MLYTPSTQCGKHSVNLNDCTAALRSPVKISPWNLFDKLNIGELCLNRG